MASNVKNDTDDVALYEVQGLARDPSVPLLADKSWKIVYYLSGRVVVHDADGISQKDLLPVNPDEALARAMMWHEAFPRTYSQARSASNG